MKHKTSSNEQIMVKKDYSKKVIFSLSDFKEKGHLMQEVTIPAHTKQRKHVHHVQTEVYYILEGETVINIQGTNYLAKKGDAFITEPKDEHFLWNKSDKEFKLLVFKINMPEGTDDTTWIES